MTSFISIKCGDVSVDVAPYNEAVRYARVLKGSHTPRSSANGMNHTRLCLPSLSWYSFTNPGGMEG